MVVVKVVVVVVAKVVSYWGGAPFIYCVLNKQTTSRKLQFFLLTGRGLAIYQRG